MTCRPQQRQTGKQLCRQAALRAYMRRHDLALLDHVGHHVAIWRARLHVFSQQVACAEVLYAKLLHQLGALPALQRSASVAEHSCSSTANHLCALARAGAAQHEHDSSLRWQGVHPRFGEVDVLGIAQA